MRFLWILLLTVVAALLVPGAASAQGRLVERSSQSLKLQGALEVEFRGTSEAGCVVAMTCDVTGTASYLPNGEGRLFVNTFRRANGSLRRDASAFVFGFGRAATQTIGVVRRGDQQCVDVRTAGDGSLQARLVNGALVLGLAPNPRDSFSGDLLRTRCAGPRAADVLAAIGTRRISRASAVGGRTVSFAADAPFTAPGLSGTVRSSIRVVLARATRNVVRRRSARRRSLPRRVPRTRQLRVPLRLTRAQGEAVVDFTADPSSCRRLDACGVTGSTTIRPRPPATPASLFLSVRSRSRAAALATVGIGDARPASVAFGGGGANWADDAGTAETTAKRDGAASCNSRADPLGGGSLELRVDRASRRLTARLYGSGLGISRCAGPIAADLQSTSQFQGGAPILASGSVPLTALRRPRQTITLTQGGTLAGPGYSGRVRSTISLLLERGHVRPLS